MWREKIRKILGKLLALYIFVCLTFYGLVFLLDHSFPYHDYILDYGEFFARPQFFEVAIIAIGTFIAAELLVLIFLRKDD